MDVRTLSGTPGGVYGGLMDGFVQLPFRSVDGSGAWHRHLPEGLHVVRDAGGWARLWARSDSRPPTEPPALDVSWPTEMCVVVSLGRRSNGGYSVVIDMVGVFDGVLTVRAWEIRPGPNCGYPQAITSPLYAVVVPAHPGEGRLVKRVADEDCDATEF